MKSLDELEEDYKEAYELLIENYKAKLFLRKDTDKARKEFNKNFNQILKKRNKLMSKYIKKNKQAILNMPKKKKMVDVKTKPYEVYNFSFKPTLIERLKKSLSFVKFYLKIKFRQIRYHFVPNSWKRNYFRIIFFFRSVFSDIKIYLNYRFGEFFEFVGGIISGIKSFFVKIYKKIDEKVTEIKKKMEEKKKAKEEKKEAEEKRKQEEKKALEEKALEENNETEEEKEDSEETPSEEPNEE